MQSAEKNHRCAFTFTVLNAPPENRNEMTQQTLQEFLEACERSGISLRERNTRDADRRRRCFKTGLLRVGQGALLLLMLLLVLAIVWLAWSGYFG